MTTEQALAKCDGDILRQSLQTIFFTLESEKIGSEALMEEGVLGLPLSRKLQRLLDSVLLAHKNLHGIAHEKLRDEVQS